MKDRVTLTLDKNLLRQVDASIDGASVKNRSHAVELLVMKALKGDMPEQAVILGGNTEDQVGKALNMVQGKPVVEHTVEMLAKSGIANVIIISGKPDMYREHLGNGERFHVQIQYVTETSPLGTAGSLHLAKPYLQGPFIMSNSDELKSINIRDMYEFHKAHKGCCTIALTTVPDPSQYGVALLNGNRIVTFIEKPNPKNAPSKLISAGLYIMELDVLDLIPAGYAKMEFDIFPKLASQDELYGYHFSGQYHDFAAEKKEDIEKIWNIAS